MPYVQRDKEGKIIGTFANYQEGYAEEWVEGDCEPEPPTPTREGINALRLVAYADPVSGSDRYFAESVRLGAVGAPDEEIETAKALGVARYQEIQAKLPWPEDAEPAEAKTK